MTFRELRQDCKIIKVGDGQMIKQLHKKLPKELRKMANRPEYRVAYKLQSTLLDTAQVGAAKQLKLRDLYLQFHSAAEADTVWRHAES